MIPAATHADERTIPDASSAPASERATGSRNLRGHWRELVLPKEHGSWSLAFEPLALGLLVAPSLPGVLLGMAVVAAFFARRPMNIAWREHRARRTAAGRRAALCYVGIAAFFFVATLVTAGAAWTVWLVPSAIAGAIFLSFDLRSADRAEIAEVAGAAAFGSLPAAMATLAGWSGDAALALMLLMLGRAIPAVLTVRAVLRDAKSGQHHPAFALVAAGLAFAAAVALARATLAPWTAAGLIALLALRTVALLVFPRPTIRARTLGMAEAAAGIAFVSITAVAWRA